MLSITYQLFRFGLQMQLEVGIFTGMSGNHIQKVPLGSKRDKLTLGWQMEIGSRNLLAFEVQVQRFKVFISDFQKLVQQSQFMQ